jgi:ubiquinone/menaquinone biosynthesis C-methylase UbiE
MVREMLADLGLMTRIDGILAIAGTVAGLDVVDIGCGEGEVARALAGFGAKVSGFDPFIDDMPWRDLGLGGYRLVRAPADAILQADRSADLVVFVFSLHHVPGHQLAGALAEARRLLRPKGRLIVAEPLAEGPNHYVMEPYHDETLVRLAASDALARHAAPYFAEERIVRFTEPRMFPDFDAYAALAVAGMRFNRYTEAEVLAPEVRRRFAEIRATGHGRLDQPVRVNIFSVRD